MAFVM
jgi:serine phosphatase RsbU (regulator of sigma subunit)